MDQHSLPEKLVILIDVFRATTVITTALNEGVTKVTPVKALQSALHLKQPNHLVAAERNGQKVSEADLGNSPLPFLNEAYKGYKLVLTTSNGTLALDQAAQGGAGIWIGSFLNANILIEKLKSVQQDVILLCAARHGHLSLEDSMLAGYLLWHLRSHHQPASDAARFTMALYEAHQVDWQSYLLQGTHGLYLQNLGKTADLQHALQLDHYKGLPVFQNGQITLTDAD